ncbi:MAG: class I SAM-dependent methyltransferase [Candidatus Diapherotrites archaeon]|uniref:Class I SAM-dependent methyltransferase n=1 Tax=Candidatus Iainarchaeum sp. TaxID=3101447 RepID=A0A8T3YMC6_9ARCH|nr:class I SAM-dependent methyltransferase [Candidatus Diapherotrites archaeon]
MNRVEFALENLHGKVLDVGYSIGGIHSMFLERFGIENLYGVDIETKEETPHYKRASAEKIPFKDGFFDSVFAGELIEHVEKPGVFLSEAARVLKKGGVIILTTPNRDSLVNRIFHNYETPIHISLFNYQEIEALLGEKGFSVEKFHCQPYSEENAYGSRNKWTFAMRAMLHGLLPVRLQEQMIVKAVKAAP